MLLGVVAAFGLLAALGCGSCTAFLDDLTVSSDRFASDDDFFAVQGGWDFRRIPLVVPYQAISADDDTWLIRLETDARFQPTIVNVRKLWVTEDGTIVSYSTNALIEGSRVEELWSVIVAAEQIELGFAGEKEYRTFLAQSGIDRPTLVDVDQVYEEYLREGQLPWFPDELRR